MFLLLTRYHYWSDNIKPKSELDTCGKRTVAREVPRCERRTCNRLQQHGFGDVMFTHMLIFTLAQVMLVHQDEAPNIYAHIAKAQFM